MQLKKLNDTNFQVRSFQFHSLHQGWCSLLFHLHIGVSTHQASCCTMKCTQSPLLGIKSLLFGFWVDSYRFDLALYQHTQLLPVHFPRIPCTEFLNFQIHNLWMALQSLTLVWDIALLGLTILLVKEEQRSLSNLLAQSSSLLNRQPPSNILFSWNFVILTTINHSPLVCYMPLQPNALLGFFFFFPSTFPRNFLAIGRCYCHVLGTHLESWKQFALAYDRYHKLLAVNLGCSSHTKPNDFVNFPNCLKKFLANLDGTVITK